MVKAIVAVQIPTTTPHCCCSHTPPESQTSSPPLTLEHLEQLFLKLIQTKSTPDSAGPPKAVKSNDLEDAEPKKEIARASKLEFKTVNEVYVSNCVQVPVS